MEQIKVGDIVKINETCVESGFAGSDYNLEDRFEVMSIEKRGEIITRLIGIGADIGYDIFPAYMLELA